MDTFLAWIKLALPNEVFANLLNENQAMIELIFEQLKSDDEENLNIAVKCVVELMIVSRVAKNNFGEFQNLVMSKVQSLNDHVQQVIQSGDFEAADQFTEIFIELAFSNMQQIIDQGSPLIDILLALLEMDESNCYA